MKDELSEIWEYWSDIEKEVDQMPKILELEDHVSFLEHLADITVGVYTDIDLELREMDADTDVTKLLADVSDELFDMRSTIHRRIDDLRYMRDL